MCKCAAIILGLKHEILVLFPYVQKPPLNIHADAWVKVRIFQNPEL